LPLQFVEFPCVIVTFTEFDVFAKDWEDLADFEIVDGYPEA